MLIQEHESLSDSLNSTHFSGHERPSHGAMRRRVRTGSPPPPVPVSTPLSERLIWADEHLEFDGEILEDFLIARHLLQVRCYLDSSSR
jgi:hypothetical protein